MTILLIAGIILFVVWLTRVAVGPPGPPGDSAILPPVIQRLRARRARRNARALVTLATLWVAVLAAGLWVEDRVEKGDAAYLARVHRMRGLALALHAYETDRGRPPTGPADLAPNAAAHPEAVKLAASGEVVILWGRSARAAPPVPVAHEPLDGGRRSIMILRSDGAVTREAPAEAAKLVGGE